MIAKKVRERQNLTRAFLIGAGATRAEYSGAPLSADFFKLLEVKNPGLFLTIKNTIEIYLDTPILDANVETVMIKSQNFPESVRISFLESLHLSIYELLASTTQSLRSHFSGDFIRPPTLLKTLLIDKRLDKSDFFMTLNYDLYLDREIISAHGGIDYGLGEYGGQSEGIKLLRNPDFSIYHLHGSLNWRILGNKIAIVKGAILPKYTSSGVNICLIPPGDKDLTPVLQHVWKTTENRLYEADELIVIGCSLNPEDIKLINLVKKFVNEKGPENIKIIYKKDSLDNWKNGRPWPIQKNSKYERYLKVTREQFKAYPYGFVLPGPPENRRYGAIEFIFEKSE